MENEVLSENSVSLESLDAFDDYYYRDVLNSLNVIKDNQNTIINQNNDIILNQQNNIGILQYHTTFLQACVFLISLFLLVTVLRNMIKKQ